MASIMIKSLSQLMDEVVLASHGCIKSSNLCINAHEMKALISPITEPVTVLPIICFKVSFIGRINIKT